MAQEHWLTEQQLQQLNQLDSQYVARSGMENAVSAGILRGRPHGGVSIAWSRDLNHVIMPLSNYKHKRVVCVQLQAADRKILFISVYMPFYDSSNRAACLVETIDTLSMLDLIINDHPQHQVVLGGDLNTELKGDSPFDPLWTEFVSKNGLAYCNEFLPPSSYTYHHVSLGHKKLNDHFIVSRGLLEDRTCHGHKILQDGDNPSDHLPISMKMKIKFKNQNILSTPSRNPPRLVWAKVAQHHLDGYCQEIDDSLKRKPISAFPSCTGGAHCADQGCIDAIQAKYDDILSRIHSADARLPRHRQGTEKDWWTPELSDLKRQSIEIEGLWISQGRPGHGPTHLERMRVRADYRRAINVARKAPKNAAWNRLHTAMVANDTSNFWNSWKTLYSKNQNRFPPMVDGFTTKPDIANSFKKSFEGNFAPNNSEKVNELNERFQARYNEYCDSHSSSCVCSDYSITIENVVDALCSMKSGKCADGDGLTAEHFQNAPFSILTQLTALFNHMLKHSTIPKQFKSGFIIPVIKDNQGNHGDVSNYRPITISPVLSKLFEHLLKIIFATHLSTSTYQFGFKKKNSTVHSLHCLRETMSYYINNGSSVYCSFLDASKAFDRLVHAGLFLKLMDRQIPLIFLQIIITWHEGIYCRVKWDDHYSEWFPVLAGVRQGGVLSPDYYCIYIDDLIYILKQMRIGCHFINLFAAALF